MYFELSEDGVVSEGVGADAFTTAMGLGEQSVAQPEGGNGLSQQQEQQHAAEVVNTRFRDPGHGGAWVLRAADAEVRLETAYLLPRES